MTDQTAEFIETVNDTISQAACMGSRRSAAILRETAALIRARNIPRLTGLLDADQIHPTDEQWNALGRRARFLAASAEVEDN